MATQHQSSEGVLERQEEKVSLPPMYKVILLNDDYTPFEFVIEVMMEIFKKTQEEAEQVTVQIHVDGKGICGVYSKEIAEFKREKVMERAVKEGHPLHCVIEAEGPAPGRSPGMKR